MANPNSPSLMRFNIFLYERPEEPIDIRCSILFLVSTLFHLLIQLNQLVYPLQLPQCRLSTLK